MKKNKLHQGIIQVHTTKAPVVEVDSEAHAAYVRFSTKKVAKTVPVTTDRCIVTIDFDAADEIIGVELIGVDEFGVGPLMQKAGITAPKAVLDRTKYVSASQPIAA